MRGVGRATAAITIVNAIPTGVGCAAGIDLGVRVEVELGTPTIERHASPIDLRTESPIVRESVNVGCAAFGRGTERLESIHIDSEIPPARGLKSSSAVSVAVLAAIADACDHPVSPQRLAALSADLSQRIGLSATGAFDDALAGLRPGILVTDNGARRLLDDQEVPAGLQVVLWIPPEPHPPSADLANRFRARVVEGRRVVQAAREGAWEAAMRSNTSLVESVMGYAYQGLRTRLESLGARVSGVSGLGPTLAAIVPEADTTLVRSGLPAEGGEARVVEFAAAASDRGRDR